MMAAVLSVMMASLVRLLMVDWDWLEVKCRERTRAMPRRKPAVCALSMTICGEARASSVRSPASRARRLENGLCLGRIVS
jgi:hypothetical protein